MLYIIVTYQGEQYIRKCIESVKQHDPASEIWVYDNGSQDSTLSILSDLGIPYHSGTKNLGFGAANNLGLSYFLSSSHSHCFLLNQDAYITNSTSQAHKVAFTFTKSIIAPLQLTGDGLDFDENFKTKYLNQKHCPEFHNDAYFNRLKHSYPIEFAPAAAWILPRPLIQSIGGFNPSFFHYGEDSNYVQRCHYHGYNVRLVPHATVLHDRQYRIPNETHKSDQAVRRRNTLLGLSNPNHNGRGWHSLIKSYIRSVNNYPLNAQEVRGAIRNRQQSQSLGAHFLT